MFHRTCAEDQRPFTSSKVNARYCSSKCQHRAENRRRKRGRTPFSKAVAAAKGPNCSNCRRAPSSKEERRFVLILDGAEATVESAHYLCFGCFKRFTRQQARERGWVRHFESRDGAV